MSEKFNIKNLYLSPVALLIPIIINFSNILPSQAKEMTNPTETNLSSKFIKSSPDVEIAQQKNPIEYGIDELEDWNSDLWVNDVYARAYLGVLVNKYPYVILVTKHEGSERYVIGATTIITFENKKYLLLKINNGKRPSDAFIYEIINPEDITKSQLIPQNNNRKLIKYFTDQINNMRFEVRPVVVS
jgi:hypothetical protein